MAEEQAKAEVLENPSTDTMMDRLRQSLPIKTTINQLDDSVEIGGRSDWGNKLVVNTGSNPVINFAFMLRVEGAFDLPCKAVKGIRRENEFDYIQEGGLNDYVHLKRKAISKPFTFQVERYVGVNWVDPMPLGTELLLPLILFVNNRTFPTLKPVRNYVFTGCTVIAKDYGELNAEVSGLLVETVTIAYREMVCVDIPNDTLSSDDVWAFDGTEKQGQGKRHYNSNFFNTEWESSPYNSKDNMERRSKKYDFKNNKKGSAKHASTANEHSKEKMVENAKQYKHTKTPDLTTGSATRNPMANEHPKEKMVENAKRYAHTETPDLTTGSATRKPTAHEYSKAEMETNAKQWPAAKDDKGKRITYGKDYKKYVTDYNKLIEEEIANAETPEEKEKANEKKQIVMSGAAAKRYEHTKTPDMSKSSAKHDPKENEHSKAEMETNAKKYDFKKKENGSAKRDPQEIEHSKAEMETNAKKYDFKNKENGSAKHNKSEPSLQEMEAAKQLWPEHSSARREAMTTPVPRLWPTTRSAKQITDFLKKN